MVKLHTVVFLVALVCVVAPTGGSLLDKFLSVFASEVEDEIEKEVLKYLPKPVEDAIEKRVPVLTNSVEDLIEKRGVRKKCSGENDGCCTESSRCGPGEGDCDKDAQCQDGMICGKYNCPWGGYDDCCTDVSGLRCKGKDNGCCTKAKPCGDGDGDCDSEAECQYGMICGTDNCPWGDKDDCCIDIRKKCTGENDGCCTESSRCGPGEGDCDKDAECQDGMICGKYNCPWGGYDDCCTDVSGLRCKGKDNGCCTTEEPCGDGDGDCDSEAECQYGMICGTDNCPWGEEDDCCIDVKKKCTGEDDGCCTKSKKCGAGEGDCDYDEDCQDGMICGKDNCPWGDEDDCCTDVTGLRCKGVDNGCCTTAKPCGEGDGDCDINEHCKEGLICGTDNCPWGDEDDCCVAPPKPETKPSTSWIIPISKSPKRYFSWFRNAAICEHPVEVESKCSDYRDGRTSTKGGKKPKQENPPTYQVITDAGSPRGCIFKYAREGNTNVVKQVFFNNAQSAQTCDWGKRTKKETKEERWRCICWKYKH